MDGEKTRAGDLLKQAGIYQDNRGEFSASSFKKNDKLAIDWGGYSRVVITKVEGDNYTVRRLGPKDNPRPGAEHEITLSGLELETAMELAKPMGEKAKDELQQLHDQQSAIMRKLIASRGSSNPDRRGMEDQLKAIRKRKAELRATQKPAEAPAPSANKPEEKPKSGYNLAGRARGQQ